MATRRLILGLLLIITCIICSCSSRLIPFTQELRTQYNLTDSDLKNLQFYVGDPISIERSVESDKGQVIKGKLATRSGQLVEEITFKSETPGISVISGSYWVGVSFEQGYTLFFTCKHPNGGKHGEYYIGTRGGRSIQYGKALYTATGYSTASYLYIDRDQLTKVIKSERTVPGRWVYKQPR